MQAIRQVVVTTWALLFVSVAFSAGAGEGDETGSRFVQKIPGTALTFEMVRLPPPAVDQPAIWMSITEVTWDAFDVFVFRQDETEETEETEERGDADAITRPSKPYIMMDRGFGHAGYPAISMSFASAQAYCEWLSVRTNRRYRLPTEAEWEYASRAGSTDPWCFGADPKPLDDHAWYAQNSKNKTHPVGKKAPNAWGLFDMHGNAAEWSVRLDEDGEVKGIVCGGSYSDDPREVAASARKEPRRSWNASDPQLPKSRWWLADGGFIGFRVVCEETPRESAH